MNLVVLGLMALIAGLSLRELATLLRARVPTQTRAVMVGDSPPPCPGEVPRIIWTYWPSTPVPPFMRACLDNWRRFAPDHELRVLDRASLDRWLPALRDGFDALPPRQQADWLRVQLLARHGGIWMDGATLLSRDFAWLHETRRRRGADFVGFYLDRGTTRPTLPLIEPGVMASVPDGPFVSALAAAFDRALHEGADAWLQHLRDNGRLERVAQAMGDGMQREMPLPLIASELLDRDPQLARLVLLRAEDGPFAWQSGVGWRPWRLHARLSLLPCPRVLPAVLALRDEERAIVERNWRRGLLSPFSALVQMIDRAGR